MCNVPCNFCGDYDKCDLHEKTKPTSLNDFCLKSNCECDEDYTCSGLCETCPYYCETNNVSVSHINDK